MNKIEKHIQNNKFLANPKYYKNNYWSVAHFQSWAARGQDGGCTLCKAKHYNATLCNKRATHGGRNITKSLKGKYCDKCFKAIEEKLNIKFKRSYAP